MDRHLWAYANSCTRKSVSIDQAKRIKLVDCNCDFVAKAVSSLALRAMVALILCLTMTGSTNAASIGGSVWDDENCNGSLDSGELAMGNVSVALFRAMGNDSDVVSNISTDVDGNYRFADQMPGYYYLIFSRPTGSEYAFSPKDRGNDDDRDSDAGADGKTDIFYLSEQSDFTRDAGMCSFVASSLGDLVWDDSDRDGIQDSGEQGIEAVNITLLDAIDVPVATTVTDAHGQYSFSGIAPGDYRIKCALPIGYEFSPMDQGTNDSLDSDADPATGLTAMVHLLPGQINNTCDVGMFRLGIKPGEIKTGFAGDAGTCRSPVCISGTIANDCTGEGLSGWTINVFDSSGNLKGATTSLSDGSWKVCDLIPGSYRVGEVLKPGWHNITDLIQEVTLGCEDMDGVTFRNVPLLCISGQELNHCTGSALSGWTIKVTDSSGDLKGATTTGPDGRWKICGLIPGSYNVSEELMPGWHNITDLTQEVLLDCDNKTGVIFSNVPLLCVSGRKINDCTGEGLSGWTIRVFDSSGELEGTTITGPDGRWEICGLLPGSYNVREELKPGWHNVTDITRVVVLSCQNRTGIDFLNAPLLCIFGNITDDCSGELLPGWTINVFDSYGNLKGTTTTSSDLPWEICGLLPGRYQISEELMPGWHNVTNLTKDVVLGCQNATGNTFFNVRNEGLLCISGYKRDNCGGGLPGWKITLTNGTYTVSTTTNDTGYYEFCGLAPGVYELAETMKPGWMSVSSPSPVSLTCQDVTNQNFTNQKLLCISGYKLDDSATGLPGWKITLTNGTYTESTTTNDTGYYEFCGLAPGVYELREAMKPGWKPMIPTSIFAELQCDDVMYVNFSNTISQAPFAVDDSAATNACTAVVIDVMSNDLNADGATICDIQSPSDNGGTAVLDDGNIIYTPAEDFCGEDNFTYKLCKPGYSESEPATVTLTVSCLQAVDDSATTIAGSPVAIDVMSNDLNADSATVCNVQSPSEGGGTAVLTGGYIVYTPASGFSGKDRFTYQLCRDSCGSELANVTVTVNSIICIEGHNIDDCAKNGLAGWEIYLTDSSGSTISTTSTDANGYYSFCNLAPGEYQVCEKPKPGWKAVTSACIDVSLSYDNISDLNFTNTKLTCVKGRNIDDCSGNGIAGWEIYLNDSSGNTIYTTSTNATGYYEFCNLAPGEYQVCEKPKPGWIALTSACRNVMMGCVNRTGVDFINTKLTCVKGRNIDDCSGNGIAGWEIYLNDSSGNTIYTTLTNATGYYEFCNLAPGEYQVCEKPKPGWIALTSACRNVMMGCVNRTGVDFINTKLTCVKGRKIDGSGIAGWEIYLNDSSGNTIYTTSTNATGYYEFCNLAPGYYQVCEKLKPGWKAVTSACHNVATTCTNRTGVDFVNLPTEMGCIAGYKLDEMAQGLAGWKIYIDSNDNSQLDDGEKSTDTNSDGYWQICGLISDSYLVREVPKAGWSQIDPPAPFAAYVATLSGSQNIDDVNFTNKKDVSDYVEGKKWYDADHNGVYDEGEPFLEGWKIYIDLNNNGQFDEGEPFDLTGSDGSYTLPLGQTQEVLTIREESQEGYSQTCPASGYYLVSLPPDGSVDLAALDFGNYKPSMALRKTASVASIAPGEPITYTIEICNDGEFTLEDVVAKDVFDGDVIMVSATPPISPDGLWHIGEIAPKECVHLSLTVLVPEIDTSFSMEQGVSGTGFVNVNNDYSTNVEPYGLTNCIHVTSKYGQLALPESSSCASVTVRPNKGTELEVREHGSGVYQSEETTSLESKNKSISSSKTLTAIFAPTSFSLPNDRKINYTTRWIEKLRSKNWATGASSVEEYLYANEIDRDSTIRLDQNGSTSTVDVSFDGLGHLGLLKRKEPSTRTEFDYDPTFESSEDYAGSFHVYERTDEYGENVAFDRSVEGQGFVSSDQRVRSSQRTYESGTGNYQTDEMIRTHTSYISKDINLTHAPASYNYSPNIRTYQDIKWNEGIWSKSSGTAGGISFGSNATAMGGDLIWAGCPNTSIGYASYIGEEFRTLDYLKKETTAKGLNEMETEARFSGQADFETMTRFKNLTWSAEVGDEESYVGEYTLSRKVKLTGVSKYDTPHISVSKTGEIFEAKYNKTWATLARYTITVTNDGNRDLSPIHLLEIFPAGAEFINATVRPDSLGSKSANWTLTHLDVGGQSTIGLLFNVTKSLDLVDIVQVAGAYDDKWATAANYTVIERSWLQCCSPDIEVAKTAEVIGDAQILYTVTLKSNANHSMAATVTDHLPAYLTMIRSSMEPKIYESGRIVWMFLDIAPGETKSVQYLANAARNGQYTNQVHVEASSIDGTGSATADDSVTVAIGGTFKPARTTRFGGWQPPERFGLNTSEEGLVM
ncbi:MAG: Cna protein B-type domain protein [Methanosaeta sp. PtaB.Bin039]|nr:MAG: Cna protein B-type domain protein [Methanosaeta sp. PtaB.Bin039]